MFFERLPDEILLHICQYLRGADVLYSLYNLNTRLNTTIAGYCHYVNLMAVSYQQFEYSVSHVLPQIGSCVRSFVLNGNWCTIIDDKLVSILYGPNFPFLFPQLQRLTIKWFTSERLLSFVDIIRDFPELIELDIRFLKGNTIDLVQSKILSANNNRLAIVNVDQDSIDFDISACDTEIFYSHIRELTMNLTASKLIPHLFALVPNIQRLHVNIDEWSDALDSGFTADNLPSLVHLIDFQLRSVNLFWTFDGIRHVFKAMPFLQQLALDIRTDDKRLVMEEDFHSILPSSVRKLDYFIRFYYSKSRSEEEEEEEPSSTSFSSTRFPIACLLDKSRHRFLIHTLPCDLHSAILTAAISKQMLQGQDYTQQIKDLYIYDVTSVLDIMIILQHFRRLRTLSLDIQNKSQVLTLPSESSAIHLKLPFLKQIEVSGNCELYPILSAAPNIEYMIVYFDCLKLLFDDERTCQLLQTRIIRLNITDWLDVQSDLLERISQVFRSLSHLVIIMKDITVSIDDFVLKILSLWKGKSRLSVDVKGSISKDKQMNLRQWLTTHSHIREDDSFAVECKDNWFDLWF